MTNPESAEFPQAGWLITLFALVCYSVIVATIFAGTVLFAWPIMGVLKLSQWAGKRAGFLVVALVLTGCAAGPFELGRLFPDGASVHIVRANLTVSMTGAGSLSADEITWVGTNGFPITAGTNLAGRVRP